MRKVYLSVDVSDHEIVNAEFNMVEWVCKRLLSEMYHKWPVKNETLHRQRNVKLFCETISVVAEWKEPVQ